MRRIFDMNNPFMRALGIAFDLIALNVLTLVCCIPIVTGGAAITAMNDIVIHTVRGEETYLIKPFFRSFKANFKKGTILWLMILVAAALLYFDYYAAVAYIPILRYGIAAIAVIVLAVVLYAFALLARYENTLKGTLKNAAILMVTNFPRTLGMVVISLGLWILAIHFYNIGAPLLLLFGLSLPCYICALFLNPVFKKLEPEQDDEPEET